jgi:hypothetical protein
MVFEDYVRDLSYLTSGVLSDLTLEFGDKPWQIHKALAVCHSKWFQKALTVGLEVRISDHHEFQRLTNTLRDEQCSGDSEGRSSVHGRYRLHGVLHLRGGLQRV